MSHERAGRLAQPSDLVDVAHLVTAYYTGRPDPDDLDQQVAFGTSGHRGSSLNTAFNEDHILATTQAIVDYRRYLSARSAAEPGLMSDVARVRGELARLERAGILVDALTMTDKGDRTVSVTMTLKARAA